MKFSISSSRCTTSLVATLCTRPAERPFLIFVHRSGLNLSPPACPARGRLLGVHAVHIHGADVVDSLFDRLFGNLVELDAAGFGGVDVQRLRQMPGDGFPFAAGSVAR
jgi:hypothetical protein